ncbi:hypothetical protein BC962_1443 [Gillisia mitskevichiae]|uniref:NlpE-like protein n=1 Tax=Gillisia mitskevichiae TaxID=270921 RepID=A0A495PRC6_9FLAO|nr:hypothetical protein [Gillisia mitskevichiae]RKS53194.1 hypothetical protein BC962_1443 [Gillisia mitskevichiae]
MKIKLLFLCSLFFMASFCERNELPKNKNSLENETYVFLYFKSEKECLDAQPSDFFINCHSEISFLENGIAEIILTDIIWRGEYSIVKKNILVTFDDNIELPEETLVFQIINSNQIKRLDDNTIWNKMTGDSIWD